MKCGVVILLLFVAAVVPAVAVVVAPDHNISPSSTSNVKFVAQILGNTTFRSDYRNCYFVLGLVADQTGKGNIFVNYAYSGSGVPCQLNYGAAYAASVLMFNATLDLQSKGSAYCYWAASFESLSSGNTGYFPCTSYVIQQDLSANTVNLTSFGSSSLPYINYNTANWAIEPVNQTFYYTFLFSRQYQPNMFGIVSYDRRVKKGAEYFEDSRHYIPLTGVMPVYNKTSVVWFAESNTNQIELRSFSGSYFSGGYKVFNLTLPSYVHGILDSKWNPAANQSEIFLLLQLDQAHNYSSVLTIVDIHDGSLSLPLVPTGDASCLITGWKNYVAAAGSATVRLFNGTRQSGGPQQAAYFSLPSFFFTAYPVNGAFATGFPGDTSAVLAVNAYANGGFGNPNIWLRSIRISLM